MKPLHIVFALLRISMGWVFFWAFIDKLFGLGFTTCRDAETGAVDVLCDRAWLAGGSPTSGFLQFGTSGPFAEVFRFLAGFAIVDWMFMVGLLGIGAALLLGVFMRTAVWSGIAMLALMYIAALPPEHNPVMSDHVIYALVLLSFLFLPVGEWWGLSKRR